MNSIKKIITLTCLASLLIISACKKDHHDEETREKAFLKQLSKSWAVSRVTLDDEDVTSEFNGMEITFLSNKTYTVVNAKPPVWNEVGTYSLIKSGTSYNLLRDDGLTITITEFTASKLSLHFYFQAVNARALNVTGGYAFNMIPK